MSTLSGGGKANELTFQTIGDVPQLTSNADKLKKGISNLSALPRY